MGACQSTPATVDSFGNTNKDATQSSESPTLTSDATSTSTAPPSKTKSFQFSSSGGSDHGSSDPQSSAAKQKMYKDKKLGISSGGSSLHADMDEAPCEAHGSMRHNKICEWKQELAADGNLTQAVVHIEVRNFVLLHVITNSSQVGHRTFRSVAHVASICCLSLFRSLFPSNIFGDSALMIDRFWT